jgi:hypothetical protein
MFLAEILGPERCENVEQCPIQALNLLVVEYLPNNFSRSDHHSVSSTDRSHINPRRIAGVASNWSRQSNSNSCVMRFTLRCSLCREGGILSVIAIFQQLSGNRELFVGLRHYRYVRLRRTEPEGERVRP